jgi:hypothetical protein
MFDVGAIVGQIVLDKSKWDGSVSKVQNDVKNLSQRTEQMADSLASVGRGLSRFSTNLLFMGGTLISPLVLSLKNAAKESYDFQVQFDRLNNSFRNIQGDLARELLPKLEKLASIVEDMASNFEKLNPQTKSAAVNIVLFTSVALIMSGILGKIVANTMILISALTRFSSVLLTLIPVMSIFKSFRLMGLATDVGVLATNVGWLYPVVMAAGAAFAGWKVGEWISGISGLDEALSGENGLFTKMFIWLEKKGINEKLEKFKNLMVAIAPLNLANTLKNMNEQAPAGIGGDLGTIHIVKQITWMDELIKKGKEFSDGFGAGLKKVVVELSNFGTLGEDVAKRTATAMTNAFSNGFFNVITGQFENMKQVAADFGESLLKILSDILSRVMMYFLVLQPLTSNFTWLKPAFGMADGTNYVPFTGVYKLHAGEEVKPSAYVREDNNQKQNLTIQNLIVSESVAAAMATREGKNVIVNVIRMDAASNGTTRKETIRR